MVDFGNDYWNALDHDKQDEYAVTPKDIGLSSGIGDPWEKIKAHIAAGATHVELGFMGAGRGSVHQPTGFTPESIGKQKREDIKQMAKVSGVGVSTHASANVIGFAGLKEGRFDDQAAAQAMREVHKAIEFAGDTTEGGSVVVHLGEFPRDVSMAEKSFESYGTEVDKGQVPLVDAESGKLIGIPKDIKVPIIDKKNPIDKKTGKFNFKSWTYKEFEKKYSDPNEAAKEFYKAYINKEFERASAEERRWFANYQESEKRFNNIKKRVDLLKDEAKKNPEIARRNALILAGEIQVRPDELSPEWKDYMKNPLKFLDKALENQEREVKYLKDASISSGKQAEDIQKQMNNVRTLQDEGVKRTAQNLAHLGMQAYATEQKKKLKKALFIAPENVFAEQYGGHPDEMIEVIQKSRKQMENLLVQKKKMSRKKAAKVAADHIKATFDIGHANTWKKYYKGSDKDFKKWVIKQAKKLQEKGVLGEIHIADNFGYEDEHLTPGQGDAPIQEVIKELKKQGFDGPMIIEGGGQTEMEGGIYGAMTGGWAHVAQSPMYRIDGNRQSWTDISGSYFGQTGSPTYLVGQTAPSKEWQFWSETPIE